MEGIHPLHRALGLVLALPAVFFALGTFWIPTIWLVQTALGSAWNTNWLSAVPFNGAIATMRSVACVLPIALGIGAAFFSPLWRNLFRTFFLIPALLLGPLSFGASCFLLSYEASTDPSNSALAQVMVLVADGMLSFCVLSIVALWLFPPPGTRAILSGRAQEKLAWWYFSGWPCWPPLCKRSRCLIPSLTEA
jgi:hypothetical protein